MGEEQLVKRFRWGVRRKNRGERKRREWGGKLGFVSD
jgi:hypothetical protein